MDNNFVLDLSDLSGEMRLLLDIMSAEGKDIGRSPGRKTDFRGIDWDLFLQLVIHHRVYPCIYTTLKNMEERQVPGRVLEALHHLYKRNAYEMLYLSGEMEQVSRLAANEQIRALFLKGPVLADYLYGDLSLRSSMDLDLLIQSCDLYKMERLLVQLGYEKDDYIQSVLSDWKWRHHHITFLHPKKGIKLEIHWRLNPGPGKEPSFHQFWERKALSPLTNHPVYMLGREDLFLFLITHGARHGWSRLRWLEDIRRLVKQPLDWKRLHLLLKSYQYVHVGGQALILASELLNTRVTAEMKGLLKPRSRQLAQDAVFYIKEMVNLHTPPLPEHVARHHQRHLFSLMSGQQKLLFISSFLYPYHEDAETLPLPKKLHFLYFPLRPVLWAWRKTKKRAFS
ncbi:nucleotidyltransferase domain-containing protein [Ferviditalea candida]|uniref:Nucleotidyltransferase family protein n=1 Tax=Ferviditalea candida TaxID=3108399 RepID=A0ABU5ZE33_9BACL|nr:nucleotidyltransferase family protein [Paenibacillaceae bacterium T2]